MSRANRHVAKTSGAPQRTNRPARRRNRYCNEVQQFEGVRCADGYLWEERAPDPPRKMSYRLPFVPGPAGLIEEEVPGREPGGIYVLPRSDEMRKLVPPISPDSGAEPVVCLFVNTVGYSSSPDVACQFANQFGALSDGTGDLLEFYHRAADCFFEAQFFMEFHGRAEFVKKFPPPILAELRADGTKIVHGPRTLLAFMWTEFHRAVAAGRTFKLCDFCGRMFVPRTKDHRFCSGRNCRDRYHNHKEGEALRTERKAQWDRIKPGGLEDQKRRAERLKEASQ